MNHSGGAVEAAEIRVVIVDDHDLLRDMLAAHLDDEPDISVIGSARTGDDALAVAVASTPHIILLDIEIPGMSAFDAARAIRARVPSVRIVFLSGFVRDHYIDAALELGASGYVTKTIDAALLPDVVRRVAQGETYFSPEVEERMVLDASGNRSVRPQNSRLEELTQRELEILRYVARGESKKEISARLGISVNTVDVHTTNIMKKLEIHDRVKLARFAVREGLVEP